MPILVALSLEVRKLISADLGSLLLEFGSASRIPFANAHYKPAS